MSSCRKLRPQGAVSGAQGFDYFEGIARETTGARAICMHLLTIPAGARARAHRHAGHETAIYVIEGEVLMYWGDRLQFRMSVEAGDMVYIPPGVPHLPVNRADRPARAVVARTDPHEQESVELLPSLDALVP